jgi:hypothetical protein
MLNASSSHLDPTLPLGARRYRNAPTASESAD